VSGMGLRQRRTWRQFVSCLAAYALALQIVLFGFAAPVIAAPGPDQDVLAAGLCLHDAGAPLAPADNSGGDEHCKFCTAGGHHAFAAPVIAQHHVVRTTEAAAPPAGDFFTQRLRPHATAQPRGPPRTA
jgi:hypothetical protein